MNFKIGNNKSKALSIFLVTILIMTDLFLLMPNVLTFAQTGKTKIIIHYAKNPSSDLSWYMWLWPDKKAGNKFDFTGNDEFGQICEVEYAGEINKVGFIARTNQWKKDTVPDRFIEQFNNGVGEVWIKEGDSKVYFSAAEAKAGVVINKPGIFTVAKLDDMNSISIETNIAFPFISEGTKGITVKANGEALTVKKVTSDEVINGATKVAKIELSENVNLRSKVYNLKVRFPR